MSRDGSMAFGAIAVIISIAALFGIVLSAVLPVLDAPDEVYHWQRAVQISHGQFFWGRQGGQTGYGGEIDSAALGFARWANRHFERSSPFSLSEARSAAAEVAKAFQYTDPSIVNDPLFGKNMAIWGSQPAGEVLQLRHGGLALHDVR